MRPCPARRPAPRPRPHMRQPLPAATLTAGRTPVPGRPLTSGLRGGGKWRGPSNSNAVHSKHGSGCPAGRPACLSTDVLMLDCDAFPLLFLLLHCLDRDTRKQQPAAGQGCGLPFAMHSSPSCWTDGRRLLPRNARTCNGMCGCQQHGVCDGGGAGEHAASSQAREDEAGTAGWGRKQQSHKGVKAGRCVRHLKAREEETDAPLWPLRPLSCAQTK